VPTWIWAAAGTVVLIAVGVLGFFIIVNVNPAQLHPSADAVPVTGAAPAERWTAAADDGRKLARAAVAEQNVPGLSVAVGVGREVVWAEGFGYADLVTRTPVDPGMRFRIGHVSKALTSAAVGLLREEGRLHLDAEIQEYVPAYPRKAWPVSLRQLMGHVAGVRHYRDTEWGDKPTVHCDRAADGLRLFATDPLQFEPETAYQYSTYGWVLVSAAVEAVASEPFADVMRARVFAPLGMRDTTSESDPAPIPNRVTSYFRGNLGREVTTDVDYSCFAGGGAFLSTPSDLVRFGLAIDNGTFLKPDTVRLLQTPQLLKSGDHTGYGLGWMLDTVTLAGQPTPLVSHASRTIEGASTSFLTFPERGLVVAVSSNMSFADMKTVAMGIAEIFAKRGSAPGRPGA
jgi:CubicO group peptidase (beta-lactamase class C family)